jgi:hypothetical protein
MATVSIPASYYQGQTDISGLLQQLSAEREEKYGQGLNVLQQVASMMAGPEFDKLAESLYETAKKETVGAGMQSLIGAGLMGTERAMQPGLQFEREVGTPFRLGLAEQKAGRIASALGNIANYMQAGTPEAGTLAYLATGGFGQLTPGQKLESELLPYLLQAAQQGQTTGLDVFGKPLSGSLAEAQMNAFQGGGGYGGDFSYMTAAAPPTATTAGGGTTGGTTATTAGGGLVAQPIYGAGTEHIEAAPPTLNIGKTSVTGAGVGAPQGAGIGYEYAAADGGATAPQIGETKKVMIEGKPTTVRWNGNMWIRTGVVGT